MKNIPQGEQPHHRESEPTKPTPDALAVQSSEQYIREGKGENVGAGFSCEVIRMGADRVGGTSWVIKRKIKKSSPDPFGMTIEMEFAAHERAHAVIEEAIRTNPEKEFARIPKPFSLLNESNGAWITMAFVPGETLFERALRALIIAYTDEHSEWTTDELASMKKDDLIACLMTDELVNIIPKGYLERINRGEDLEEAHFVGIALTANKVTSGPSPVISARQCEAIVNTLNALHAANIHHRDLHASNIMLTPDGAPYIIDFGTAIIRSREDITNNSAIYQISDPDEIVKPVRLLVDDDMVAQLQKIARKIA